MPDREARDAYIAVEVDLPDGQKIAGRTIPFRKGLTLKNLLYRFSETMEQKDFDALWAAFSKATGITEEQLTTLCPSITLLELTDLISRFIYLLRPVPTAAQGRNGTPVATAAPAPAAPPEASEASAPVPARSPA